jgi:hypothetical protein
MGVRETLIQLSKETIGLEKTLRRRRKRGYNTDAVVSAGIETSGTAVRTLQVTGTETQDSREKL